MDEEKQHSTLVAFGAPFRMSGCEHYVRDPCSWWILGHLKIPIGGTPEMIGSRERGLVCKTIDPTEMAQHLTYLLSEPSVRLEMGNRGARWVKETCNMSAYLADTVKIYKRVLSGKLTAAGINVGSQP